jgi:hypothetical protein
MEVVIRKVNKKEGIVIRAKKIVGLENEIKIFFNCF